jgi:hypothetical protein
MRTWSSVVLGTMAAVVCVAYAWTVQAQGMLANGALEDTRALAAQGAAYFQAEAPVRTVVKVSGPYREASGEQGLLAQGQELSKALGMPVSEQLHKQQGEAVYRQVRETAEGCTESLLLTGLEEGHSFLIVKKECTAPAGQLLTQVPAWQEAMERALSGPPAWTGVWNVMLQGELSGAYAQQESEQVLRGIAAGLSAVEAERYEDRGTVSVSYTSKVLKQSVKSGAHDIHLQAGLHKDSKDGSRRLTIGTPVITTEY